MGQDGQVIAEKALRYIEGSPMSVADYGSKERTPMEDVQRQRYEQALELLEKDPDDSFEQLMVAICLTQLEEYPSAREFYGLAIQSFLGDRFWFKISQPDLLIATYILANRTDCYPQVVEEIEAYKLDPRGDSLYAFYAYAASYLLSGEDEKANDCVARLFEKPTVTYTFAAGRTIKSIIEHSQPHFDEALGDLLDAHRGKAKFGGLRETPEGFLSLPAMSLSKIALERGLEINVESEYLSQGYLDYLLDS
jgi:tetratricopeptide (TPR) repeat protein